MPFKRWRNKRAAKNKELNGEDNGQSDDQLETSEEQAAPNGSKTTTTEVEPWHDDSDFSDDQDTDGNSLKPGTLATKSNSAPPSSSRRMSSDDVFDVSSRSSPSRQQPRPVSALDEMFCTTNGAQVEAPPSARSRPSLDEMFCTTDGQRSLVVMQNNNTQQALTTGQHIKMQIRRNVSHIAEVTSRPVLSLHRKATRNRIRSTPSSTPIYPRNRDSPTPNGNHDNDDTERSQKTLTNDSIVITDFDDVE